jgi:hypothetical protein
VAALAFRMKTTAAMPSVVAAALTKRSVRARRVSSP